MDFRLALDELGVRNDTLTDAEKERLDRDGYLPLENVFSRAQAVRMIETNSRPWVRDGTGQEGKETTVVQAQNKCDSDVYDICFTHPRVRRGGTPRSAGGIPIPGRARRRSGLAAGRGQPVSAHRLPGQDPRRPHIPTRSW
jgi:hypothetical protein